jgi:PAS domain S-box-containing protein
MKSADLNMGKSSDQKNQHLHRIIDTVREINRVLVTEKDSSQLIKNVCTILVNTRQYYFAGIFLIDKEQNITQVESSGIVDGLEELKAMMTAGDLPLAHQMALRENKLIIVKDPLKDCPLNIDITKWTTFIAPIQIETGVHGLLCAAIPKKDAEHPKEQMTFTDFATNIGFALGKIKQQEEINKSETRYRNLVNDLSDALFILQDGVIKFVNPMLSTLSEFSEKELIGKDFSKFIAPAEVEKIFSIYKKRVQGEKVNNNYESIAQTKSGQLIPVNVTVIPIEYDNRPAFQIILRDISDLKNILQNLHESQERFQFFTESAFEGIVIHDNGIILDVNDALIELSGYTRDELIGSDLFSKLVSENDRQKVTKNINTQTTDPFTVKAQKKNGEHRYAEIVSKEISYKGKKVRIGAVRDISERYYLEREVKQTQQKLNRLLDNLPGMAYTCLNNPSWDMNFISQGCFDILGYHPQELIGKAKISYNDLIHPDDREYVWKSIQAAIEQKQSFEFEYRVLTKQHEEKWVWERGTAVYNHDDILLEGFITDITKRKKAIEEVKKSEENYRALFNAINDAVFIQPLDLDFSHKFKEVNQVACEKFGYTREEFLQINPSDLIPNKKEIIELSKENRKHLVDSEWLVYETERLTKNGKMIPLEMSSRIYELDGQKMILSLARDISERKKSEDEIHRLLQDLTLILDNDPTFIVYKDTNNNILRITQTVANITGLPREQIEGKNSEEVYPEMANSYYQDDLEIIRTGKPKFGVIEPLYDAKGEQKWLLSNKIPTKENGKDVSGIIIFSSDITQLKLYEEQLLEKNTQLNFEKEKAKEEKLKYQALFTNSASAMYIVNPENGNIMDANQAACKFYNYSYDVLTTLNISNINTLPFDEIKKGMSRAKSGQQSNFIYKHKLADGSIKDVEIYSSSVEIGGKRFLFSIIHDITNRKELEGKNMMLSKAIDSSPVSIVITDIEGNIEYANPFFEEKTGYDFGEVLGKNPHLLKSGKQDDVFYKNMWRTILSGENWYGEFHNKKKNGELFWEQASISPVYGESGKIEHFIAVKEDVTEKKQTLIDLQRAKEKAEESDKLKSSFLANMSHEIRTPMNGILGFTELLKDPSLTGDQQHEFIEIIQISGDRMLNTINDIIDISKIESGLEEIRAQEINLETFIQGIYAFFLPMMQTKGIEFSMNENSGNPVPLINTDPDKLSSILTNLIKNAHKFTNSGSITVDYSVSDTNIKFVVQDTGVGIPANRQKAIFERFIQADIADSRVFEGSGLGLAITKSYVEMMGGNIQLESEIGVGTTFQVNLPIREHHEEKTIVPEQAAEIKPVTKQLKIILAEDDPVSAGLLKILLRKTTDKLLIVENGKEAVDAIKANPEYDLILMDIKMPIMDGFTATKKIREFNKEVKIVAQTAFAQPEESSKAFEVGCDDFISKPINRTKLLQTIQNLFAE